MSKLRNFFVYASRFAATKFVHSSQVPASVTFRKAQNTFWNDAGSMQLASDGVCIIDEEKLTGIDVDNLVYLLGENKFQIKVGDLSSREMDLNVAIWIYQKETCLIKAKKNKNSVPLDLFPLVMRFSPHDVTKETNPIDPRDWEAYFTHISQIDCTLESDARDLLKNYYLTARIELGPQCGSKDFSALISYAESFAKLSLRSHGIIQDAILAIAVYEMSCKIKYGLSVLPEQMPTFFELKEFFLDESMVRK